jgi:arylsulfatase A-like enzyme
MARINRQADHQLQDSGLHGAVENAPAQGRDDVLGRIGVCVLWALPLLIAHLYLKYTLLEYGGLDIAQRALSLHQISTWTYLHFYARDVLETLVFVPAVLFALTSLVPRKFRPLLLFVVVEFGLMIAIVCWGVYINLGRYPGPELIVDFARTYRVERAAVDPFTIFSPLQLAKMAAILSLVLGPPILRMIPRLHVFGRRNVGWLSCSYVALVGGATLLAFDGATTSYHRGQLERVVREYTAHDALRLQDGTRLSRDELRRLYQRVVFPDGGAENAAPAPKTTISARTRPNVIVIVLETASQRDYPFSTEEMPEVAKLLGHSIVAQHHLSVYPYSVRANFSIFTSVYDLDSKLMMADLLKDANPRPMDALPYVLRERGYVTRFYYANPLVHKNEAWMWPYLGFDEMIVGAAFDSAAARIEAPHPVVARDRAMFDRVIGDLEQLQADGKPFMFAVLTTLGHSPYPDLRSAADRAARPVAERAELVGEIRRFADTQIGRIVDSLRRAGALEDTILVITGDHGVRSIPDDPRLDLRVLNEASFHVPLIVHYPRGIDHETRVEHITSHVDIEPTILDLAGIPTGDMFLEGLPVTDPRIEDRVTFFLGGHYYGSNGLYYRGRYFMENEIAELAYVNDAFAFGSDDLTTSRNAALADEAAHDRETLHQFRRSQMALASWLRDSQAQE